MPAKINVEVWIASCVLGEGGRIFSKQELLDFIRDTFADTRSGVSTHISSYCVASAEAKPGKFRYLTRVGQGRYRVYRPGDPTHPTKVDAPLHPPAHDIPAEFRHLLGEEARGTPDRPTPTLPETGERAPGIQPERPFSSEADVTDFLLLFLRDGFGGSGDTGGVSIRLDEQAYRIVPEGKVDYQVGSRRIKHRSDLLMEDEAGIPRVSIEVKYRSAVTDQFKSRSYDFAHMKREHPDLMGVMVYVKSNTGISPELAREICHDYDLFYSVPEVKATTVESWMPLLEHIRAWLG